MGLLALLILRSLSSCSDDALPGSPGTGGDIEKTIQRKVAVFYTNDDTISFRRTAQWAMEEIGKAQKASPQVKVDYTWYNCDHEDWELSMEDAILDSTVTAIIAPSRSSTARKCYDISKRVSMLAGVGKKPLIFPKATSVELHRQCNNSGFTWFLSESDMSQAEMIIALFDKIGFDKMAVVASNDIYGKSFSERSPFIATEREMPVMAVKEINTTADENELRQAITEVAEECGENDYEAGIILASGNSNHYLMADKIAAERNAKNLPMPTIVFTDNATMPDSWSEYKEALGMALAPDVNYGFNKAFSTRYPLVANGNSLYGEAFYYDAILMAYLATYGSSVLGVSANDVISRLTEESLVKTSWQSDGIAAAMAQMDKGVIPQVNGASGDWDFLNGVQLNTCYFQWYTHNGEVYVPYYFDTKNHSLRSNPEGGVESWKPLDPIDLASSKNVPDAKDYGERNDCWAILIATSRGWDNYRHDADVLAMYHLLKSQGFDDSHILLVVNDELAFNEHNKLRGVVKNTSEGNNLYDNIQIDYRTHDLTPDDLEQLLTSDLAAKINAHDNVFIYWCGHGKSNGTLSWLGNNLYDIPDKRIAGWIDRIASNPGFRKMFVCIEACYSGSVAKAITTPGVFCMTSANAMETSSVHGDDVDPILGVYLSNEFCYQFMQLVSSNPALTLSDLYNKLYVKTSTSHVTISDIYKFGSLTKTKVNEFFP